MIIKNYLIKYAEIFHRILHNNRNNKFDCICFALAVKHEKSTNNNSYCESHIGESYKHFDERMFCKQ